MNLSQTEFINKNHIFWFSIIVLSVITGISTMYVDPLFIILGIIGLVNIILMLKYPYWALLMYLILYMLRPAEIIPALAPLRLELLIGTFAIVISIIREKFSTGAITFPLDKIWLSLFLMLFAIYLSLYTSFEKTQTFNTGIAFIKIIVFVYLIISTINTEKKFTIFVTCYLGLIIYIAIDAFIAYMSGDFIHTMNVDRIRGNTSAGGDPNALGATIVTTIPLAIASIVYYKNIFMRIALWASVGLFVWVVVITASRSGLIALLTMILVEIYFSKHRTVLFVITALLMIGGWFILPEQYQNRYARFSDIGGSETLNNVSSGRIEIWKAGLSMISAYPIFGIGAGAFPWAGGTGEFGAPQEYYSHNLYIQVFATMGLVGLLVWLAFLYNFLSRLRFFIKTEFSQSNAWAAIYAKSFVVIIISLLFSGMFGHNLFRITWFIIAGLTISLTNVLKINIENSDFLIGKKRQSKSVI